MPVSPEELVRLLALLAQEENLKVTVKETMKGGAMAGAGAVIGGFCGGPIGIAVGGTLGSLAGAIMTSGKFKSVPEILNEMDPETRFQLFEHFQNVITGFNVYDVPALTRLVMGDPVARDQALSGLKNFFLSSLKMDVTS